MTEERVKRKLSAILSADVAGYSRLMGKNEVSTVRTLEAYRKAMSDLIEQFRGRVADSPGDNLLAEFSSVVDYWKKYSWPDLCHPLGDDDFECE